MDKITISINGRAVFWEVPTEVSILIAQSLVQSYGPAKDVEE